VAFRMGRAVLELSIEGGAFVRGAADAKATMRDLARGIAQTQRDIGKQAFTFSGRQQIAEAVKITEAIKRVGGIDKLTAQERIAAHRQIAAALEKERVAYGRQTSTLVEYEKAIRRSNQAQEQAAKGSSLMAGLRGQVRGLNIGGAAIGAGIGGAVGGFIGTAGVGLIQNITSGISEAITKGPQLGVVSQSFDRLTRSVGESSDAMISALRPATRGLVADLDLMLATNKAVLLGLPVTRQEMATLARTAVTLGRAMGLDATTALDSLITGLGRSSPLLLDNLGLVVKEAEAHEKYAASLGKTANELTEAEKKQAFYTAAMEAARAKTAELGETTNTAADNWKRLTTSLGNAATAASAAANESVVLTRATGALASMAELAAENLNLIAEAKERLEKRGKSGSVLGFGRGDLLREIDQIVIERAGTPANPLKGPAPIAPKASMTAEQVEAEIAAITDWNVVIKAAQAELKNLSAAERDLIAAAERAGVSTEGQLEMLRRFGVHAGSASVALRLLNETQKKSADDGQKLLDRFNGREQRENATNLAKALNSGQLQLARMTEDAQRAIAQALEEGAAAWKAWGGVVPVEVNRALAAVKQLPQMVAELRALETPPPFAPVPEGDVAIAQGMHDLDMTRAGAGVEGMKTREAAARDHAKVLRDIDLSRSEAVIRQAEREGVKKAQLLVMESILAQQKRNAEILDAQASLAADEDALNERRRRGELETVQFEAELARRQQQHQDHVDQINEQWAIGEAERRDMIRRESSFWASELGKRIAGELRGAAHEATGKLFTTFFTGVDAEAKKQAKAAREDYERIANSGRASAEEITRAYRAMRQAEEAANTSWADRFKRVWDGIKRHLFNIFDQILEAFVNHLIKGMLRSLAASALGQKVTGWLSKLIPGMSPGGAGVGTVMDAGGGLLGKVPGLGNLLGLGGGVATTAFSTTAGGTLAASMIAPSIASAAVPAAITSAGVSAGVAAGAGTAAGTAAAAGGAGASAGAGGGAALGFLANPAFWTNPYTIAAMVGIAAFPLVKNGIVGIAKGIGAGVEAIGDGIGWFFDDSPGSLSRNVFRRLHARRGTAFEELPDWVKEDDTDGRKFAEIQAEETRHAGGVIGDRMAASRAAYAERFGDLKPNEVIVKLLKGEGVLTPEATTAIGGKPIIDLLNAGNHKAIIDAIRGREIKVSDVLKATGAMRRGGGMFGGLVGAPSRLSAALAPRPLMTPAIDRAIDIPGVVRDGLRSTAAPAMPTSGAGGSGGGQPITVNNYFQPKGVLDAHSVRELHEKHIVPMTEESIRTGRLGRAVQKRALE
jgi:hypothetical protein